jgi:hypothetical protein
VEERDGWYTDIPGLGCTERFVETELSAPTRDRVYYEYIGTGGRGYPLEETTHKTQDGIDESGRLELLEFSATVLDSSLFEVPADYSPALRTFQGNFDMSRPDTLRNRVQEYWTGLLSAMRRIFE